MVQSIVQGELPRNVLLVLRYSFLIFFLFFFSYFLINFCWYPLLIFLSSCNFLLSKKSSNLVFFFFFFFFFFFWQFGFFCYLSIPSFPDQHGTFFNDKFYTYILAAYSCSLFLPSTFFPPVFVYGLLPEFDLQQGL